MKNLHYPDKIGVLQLLDEQIQVNCHVTLETTCGEGTTTKAVEVNYLIVDALSPYNTILGRPTIMRRRQLFTPVIWF